MKNKAISAEAVSHLSLIVGHWPGFVEFVSAANGLLIHSTICIYVTHATIFTQ